MSWWNRTNLVAFVVLLAAWWWAPWWLFLFFWLATVVLIPNCYWAILPALIFDLTYSAPQAGPFKLTLPLALLTIVLVWLIEEIKHYIRV